MVSWIVLPAVGAVGAVCGAPYVIAALGFKAGGIAAGSTAAGMMSSMGGGATASGSLVAMAQSIGATGTVLGSTIATTVTAATGATVGYAARRWPSITPNSMNFTSLMCAVISLLQNIYNTIIRYLFGC